MNTKKSKHKKPNKPQNPTPPQKLVKSTKSEESVQEVQPICEVKSEQAVPQVLSEVVEVPVFEKSALPEMESDTPNKPKRNKGKKKKQEQDDDFTSKSEVSEENVEKISTISMETDVLILPTKKGIKHVPNPPSKEVIEEEKNEEEIKNLLDEAAVVPSAKKRKNKKKSQEKCVLDSEVQEMEPESTLKEPTMEITKKIDPEVKELSTDTQKQDNQKKNKKKKRNDSEKSDKSTNIVSCTSAFQKLLVEDENIDKQKLDETGGQNQAIDLAVKKEITDFPVAEVKFDVEASTTATETKEEGKSKKKNKKDKKHPDKKLPEPIMEPDLTIPKNTTHDEQYNLQLEKVSSEELKQVLIEPMEKVLQFLEKEPSPKPKAKIAKPVQKSRIDKQDIVTDSEENIREDSLQIKYEEIEEQEVTKQHEIKIMDELIQDVVEFPVPELILQETEKICIPIDAKMGKKRKKSPKPSKTKESIKVQENNPEIFKTLESEENKTKSLLKTETSILKRSEIEPEIKEPAVSGLLKEQTKPEYKSGEILIDTLENVIKDKEEPLLKTKTNIQELSVVSEKKTEDEGFEIKTSKKKKKTPKIPSHLDVSAESKESILAEKKEDTKEKANPSAIEKIDFPLDLSFSSEVEVRSLKTDESGSSTCENTPDIFFIRSSSQQLFDNNNNTFIQEVLHVDEIELTDQVPLIEGSGETLIPTPELVSCNIGVSEIGKNTDDKTDLKSKMMEVNQDMEELRLSIERSLAEFTAMDTCEEEIKIKPNQKIPLKLAECSLTDVKTEKCSPTKELDTMPEIKTKTDIPLESDNKLAEKSKIDLIVETPLTDVPPVCPTRKDNKGKSKSKKKGSQDVAQTTTATASDSTPIQSKDTTKKEQPKSEKSEHKSESTKGKGKQQSVNVSDIEITDNLNDKNDADPSSELPLFEKNSGDFEPIENFEDALTSSIDDVNKTFEMIAEDVYNDNEEFQKKLAANKPEINITVPTEDSGTKKNEKESPVSQPKNLLGHYNIPVQSNKTDYKKEKNKTPNARQARVKIKDSVDIERNKQCKESQTDTKSSRKYPDKSVKESFSKVKNDGEEYVYKYSFRKVFLQSACQICNKDLPQGRVPCGYCNLVFYCGARHKDEDWPQHQALCFAVSTLAHMKDQKHIYADAQLTTGQDYRLLRMQMIVSTEKVLKRRLVPWEQEALLYPRICADIACREWKQGKLKDCEGCGQLSYCADNPEHLPKTHQRWCKSYSLYQKLVTYQQTKGRLEPKLPTKVMSGHYEIPAKMNEILASMYEEKIDMNDIQYAALTQLATAPLTTAYCLQMSRNKPTTTNGVHKKHTFTIHVVGAELQFEADALNKWEVFFLHLQPDVQVVKVVLVSEMLNPGNLPLDLLKKIRLCDHCRQNKRRVVFIFEDNKTYSDYRTSDDFINPDVICAFNPGIQRSSIYNGKDPWPASITTILKLKQPFIITSYTLNELRKDIARVKQCSKTDFKLVSEPGFNSFASVRPDRNFISDDEMPLLFKNYCVAVLLGC